MPWGDRPDSRTEFHVRSFVFDDCCGNSTVYPFDLECIAMLIFGVTGIFWMHNYIFVSEFCFRTHCADREWTIFEIVKWIFFFDTFRFHIGKGSLMFRTPVDSSLTTIHKIILMHFYERLPHFFYDVWVKGKAIP